MNLIIKSDNKKNIFNLIVTIDYTNCLDLQIAIDNYLQDKHRNITINLVNVKYIDSTGIGILISSFKYIKQNGENFKVINPTNSVKRIFKIINLIIFFNL